MPYLITSRPGDTGPGAAVERLGQNVTQLIGMTVEERRRKREAAQAEALASRRMDIEEQRAQASLLREENQASLAEERRAERDADREGSLQNAEAEAGELAGEALPGALKESAKASFGLLGPYGLLNQAPLKKAAARAKKIQETMANNVEQARRMSPAAADRFLRRETANLKEDLLAEDYQSEFESLQNALLDGKFDDPFMSPRKGDGAQEPSPQAQKKAEEYSKLLQQSLKEKKPPGAVLKLIEKEYTRHDRLVARKAAWEAADQRAKELTKQIQDVAASAPAGVDATTGEDAQGALVGRVAQAASEWASTNSLSFRRANDPSASLAGLQKILFGMKAEADPVGFLDEQMAPRDTERAVGARQADEQQRGEASNLDVQGYSPPAGPPQTQQAAPGGGGAAGGLRARGGGKEARRAGLEQFVASELQGIARSGATPEEKADLIMRRAAEQGYDLDDPEVGAALEKAVLAATHR